MPERKSKDSVLPIRCRSSAAYTLGEKELNESTDLLFHFICSGDTAPNPSKQMWCTQLQLKRIGFGDAKSESKSIKHIQTILRDYGIVGTSFVLHWIGNQQPWVHGSILKRSNEIGILAKHNMLYRHDMFFKHGSVFQWTIGCIPNSVPMVFHDVLLGFLGTITEYSP